MACVCQLYLSQDKKQENSMTLLPAVFALNASLSAFSFECIETQCLNRFWENSTIVWPIKCFYKNWVWSLLQNKY